MECNVEYNMDGDGINHGIEVLVKINTQLLVKAFSNKTSFIPSNRAIGILFDANCTGLEGTKDQVSFRMRASYSSCMA